LFEEFLVALVCRKKVEEFCFVLFWIFLVCEEVYEISLTLIVGVVVKPSLLEDFRKVLELKVRFFKVCVEERQI
jgi:hypothetical protein